MVRQFQELLDKVDEAVLKPFLDATKKQAQMHYNKLIQNNYRSDEAMFEVVTKTAYLTLKHAAAIALFFHLVGDSDQPITDELSELLKTIH